MRTDEYIEIANHAKCFDILYVQHEYVLAFCHAQTPVRDVDGEASAAARGGCCNDVMG